MNYLTGFLRCQTDASFKKISTCCRLFGSVSKPCTPVVHIKIAGKWMFIPLKMVLIGIDPYPFDDSSFSQNEDYHRVGAFNP